MKICRLRARLYDKNVRATHVLQNLKIKSRVAELAQHRAAALHSQIAANLVRQGSVRGSRENLELIRRRRERIPAPPGHAGALQYSPRDRVSQIKIWSCGNAWAARRPALGFGTVRTRRTATRQRGFHGSGLEQIPLECFSAGNGAGKRHSRSHSKCRPCVLQQRAQKEDSLEALGRFVNRALSQP